MRQRKAGAGSDKDDETQARLVRETYALDDFGELYDDRVSGAPSPSVTPAPNITERQLDHAATLPASNDLTSAPDSSVSRRRLPAQRSSRRVQSDEEEEEEEQENSDDQEENTGFKSHLRRRHHRLIPHPLARPIVVTTRLRVAGRVQELSEADLDFLDIAFELDQRNPKQKQSRSKNDSKSRLRYETTYGYALGFYSRFH